MIDKAEANRLRASGMTLRAVAEKLGCTREYVRQITPRYPRNHYVLSPEAVARRSERLRQAAYKANYARMIARSPVFDEIRNGYGDGAPVRKIAEKVGLTRNAVIGIAHRLGLKHPRARA